MYSAFIPAREGIRGERSSANYLTKLGLHQYIAVVDEKGGKHQSCISHLQVHELKIKFNMSKMHAKKLHNYLVTWETNEAAKKALDVPNSLAAEISARSGSRRAPSAIARRGTRAEQAHEERMAIARSLDVVPNDAGDLPALKATDAEKLKKVAKLLKSGFDPNAIEDRDNPSGAGTPHGWSVLMTAAMQGSLDMVKLLVNAGATYDYQEPGEGFSALYLACQQDHLPVVEVLLGFGGKSLANMRIHDGRSNIFVAAHFNNCTILQALVDAGGDFEQTSHGGVSPLWVACQIGCTEAVALLLKLGARAGVCREAPKSGPQLAGYAAQRKMIEGAVAQQKKKQAYDDARKAALRTLKEKRKKEMNTRTLFTTVTNFHADDAGAPTTTPQIEELDAIASTASASSSAAATSNVEHGSSPAMCAAPNVCVATSDPGETMKRITPSMRFAAQVWVKGIQTVICAGCPKDAEWWCTACAATFYCGACYESAVEDAELALM